MSKLRNKQQLEFALGKEVRSGNSSGKYHVDQDPLAGLIAFANAQFIHSIYDSSEPARRVAGVVKTSAGRRTCLLRDELGISYEFAEADNRNPLKWTDPQLSTTESSHEKGVGPKWYDSLLDRIQDTQLPAATRLEAILKWARADMIAAAGFVLNELSKTTASPDWRNALVFAADAVNFDSQAGRAKVCTELLRIARSMRDTQVQDDRPVVLCAIHRVGSIIPRSRVEELDEFLAPGSAIDTRLATLQTIVRIFEAVPPDNANLITGISDRAATLAEKRWDVDVFAAGEISALAIEGTITIAVLGDERLDQLLTDAESLGKPWVIRKLIRRLDEIRKIRVDRKIEVLALDEAIAKLKHKGQRDASGAE